mgnify:CR=1 FL=1
MKHHAEFDTVPRVSAWRRYTLAGRRLQIELDVQVFGMSREEAVAEAEPGAKPHEHAVLPLPMDEVELTPAEMDRLEARWGKLAERAEQEPLQLGGLPTLRPARSPRTSTA